MPKHLFADTKIAVKTLANQLTSELTAVLDEIDLSSSPVDLERDIARMALAWGRDALAVAWSEQCRQATVADIEQRGLDTADVTLRSERDYAWAVTSTLGPVAVASFAYRDRSVPVGSVTRVPARDLVMPLHRHCRSSELCLQWECRLGSQQTFRNAQASLSFFTHGATSLEDTTIARHLVTVAEMIDTRWLYRRPEQVRDILYKRATRDRETGRPLVHISSDAHLLRRYVDDTWQAAWKNVNGIRLWCVDKDTGAIIHLGGEYTMGDCHVVEDAFAWLQDIGVLPADGDYGDGVAAQYVVVTDGAQWLVDRVADQFPDAIVVLDAYHALEYLADHAATLYEKGSRAAKRMYKRMVRALFGKSPPRRRQSPLRKGHSKRKRRRRRTAANTDVEAGVDVLLELLRDHQPPPQHANTHANFIAKLDRNASRMDYPALRQRGAQIGSGAMESLHRNASQQRLKLPGARWSAETAQAILDLRMLALVGRWEDFWERPEQGGELDVAFAAAAATRMSRMAA